MSLHFGSGGSPQASPEAVATNFTVAISLYGLDPMSAMNAMKLYNFPAQA